ncbi:hypothetical protein ACVCL3_02750 [Rhodanobacter sp. UC4437_H4]
MEGFRFSWLGETRREALRALIAAEVSEWSQEWWIEHEPAEIHVRAVDHGSFVIKGAAPYMSTGEAGSLALFLGGRGAAGVGRHLAGSVEEEDAGWAERIGEEALGDFAARVFRRGGVAGGPGLRQSAASPDLSRPELGSCILAIAVGRLGLNLACSRRLIDRLVPPQTGKKADLASRREALGKVPLRLDAIMDFGSVNLAQLTDLRVGELLVGDTALEEPLSMRIEGGIAITGGYLRRVGAKRAVMLDGIHSQEEYKP